MIQLFINGNEIILPENYKVVITEENPEIATNGIFTLDNTVSLLEAKNIKAFNFINRINNKTVNISANALLIIKNKFIYGKIVITEYTDVTVTFQFIAGNSELNYVAKLDNRKIWELNWGSIQEITPEIAKQSLNIVGYTNENHFVCAPIMANSKILNDFRLDSQTNNYDINIKFRDVDSEVPLPVDTFYSLETAIEAMYNRFTNSTDRCYVKLLFKISDTERVCYMFNTWNTTLNEWNLTSNWVQLEYRFVAQPYLLYYITKLPVLLGYSISENVLLNDVRAQREYFLNTVDSNYYSDFLPDVTISDFITYIENKYNAIFLVDNKNKSISITNLSTRVYNKNIVKLQNVLDNFECEIEDSDKTNRLCIDSLTYDLPDTDYFKFHKIKDNILSKCTVLEFNNMVEMQDYCNSNRNLKNSKIILRDKTNNRDYIFDKERNEIGLYRYSTDLYHVNKFRNFNENGKNVLSIDIIPASMTTTEIMISYFQNGGYYAGGLVKYQLPYTDDSYFLPADKGIYETIKEDETTRRNSKFIVAMYSGLHNFFIGGSVYPLSNVDNYREYTNYRPYAVIDPINSKSLILNEIWNDYFETSVFDKRIFKFELIDNKDVNIEFKYEHNNTEYIPIKLEREISNTSTKLTGYFYRLK